MKGRALLFAAGFVVGVGVGVVAGVTLPAPVGMDGRAAEAPRMPAAPDVAPARASDRRRAETGAREDPIAAAIAAVSVDVPTEGTGRVTGTVRDPDGAPVAGVRVRGFPQEPDGIDDDYEDYDVDLAIRTARYLRMQSWRDAARRTATSGPDGAYALEGMLDTPYWLRARAEGYEIETAEGSEDEARDGDVVDFVASPRFPLDVRVVFPDGSTPDFATVVFTDREGERTYVQWPDMRVYLAPGGYDVRATVGDERWIATRTGILVSAEAQTPALELELRARPGIAGRLTFADDAPPPSVRVRMTSLPSGAEASSALFSGRYEFKQATDNDEYRFRFLDLAPGNYVVAVEGLGGIDFDAMWTVAVADTLTERVFDVPPPDPSRYVEVRVFDPAGRLTQDSYVALLLRREGWAGTSQREVRKRPDGALWLARPDPVRAHPEARHFLSVTDKRYGHVEMELASLDVPAEVHFRSPARAAVTVTGLSSRGQQGELSVLLRPVRPGTYQRLPSGGAAPGIDGVARPPAVQPGAYDVLLVVAHNYLPARPVVRARRVLESGDNRVTLTVPALHGLVVEVGEVGRPWTLRATAAAGLAERLGTFFVDAKPDVTGRVEFARLPAGEYDVRAYGAGAPQEPRRMTVPSEGPVPF